MQYAQKELFLVLKRYQEVYDIQCSIIQTHTSLSQFEEAQQVIEDTKRLLREHDLKERSTLDIQQGIFYIRTQKYKLALASYQRVLEGTDPEHKKQLSQVYGNMSICYKNLGQYEKTLNTTKKRYEVAKEFGNKRSMAIFSWKYWCFILSSRTTRRSHS